MAVTPDRTTAAASEAAAHRRWLITLAITILFGGFGALMAYLSYANSTKPATSSPRRSSPSGKSPSPVTTPSTAPTTAPTAPADVTPPAAAPSSDPGDKHDNRKEK